MLVCCGDANGTAGSPLEPSDAPDSTELFSNSELLFMGLRVGHRSYTRVCPPPSFYAPDVLEAWVLKWGMDEAVVT